jgi:hypothetical protein
MSWARSLGDGQGDGCDRGGGGGYGRRPRRGVEPGRGGCGCCIDPPYKFFAQKSCCPALKLTSPTPTATMLMRDCHSGARERSLVLARRDCSAGVCVARIPAYATLTYPPICRKLL